MTQGKVDPTVERRTLNLKQLAEHLHLSQTTVSLVLNNAPAGRSIPQVTRDRVFEAARHFHYRPNYFARSLRNSRSMSVGVIVPDLSDGYFPVVMNAIESHLLKSHYFYVTASHYRRPDLVEEYSRRLMERAVDGLLLVDTPAAITVPVPAVALSSHNPAPGVTNVVLDHDLAARLALTHLTDLGHQRIAFMQGAPDITDARYRWISIVNVAQEMGIEIAPERCMQLQEASQSPESGHHLMRDLLELHRDFTAVFCFNDISALGAIRAICDTGLRVPQDISVIGFDDIITAAFSQPSLTTVKQPLRQMGLTAAEVLLERIADSEKEFPAEIVMEPELIVRESTGPAPRLSSQSGKTTTATVSTLQKRAG
ncbi:MAG TPA: LacI family DNA-binding transcriptional regulator [Acidobacteriaceae bacterium]|jgi:LacI family repressor for deo operon, udp, cdd, tsx, nupC, and nupG|nr:LacI family DNA-binding transcriptional regulator [Acidobacteriaceae bacterium]